MRAPLGLVLVAVLGGCLQVPPAIDDRPIATPAPVNTAPAPVASRTAGAQPAIPAATCPVATGRAQFCEGRKVCSRDHRGCETCKCNAELDSDRARFEQMDPWDRRQR